MRLGPVASLTASHLLLGQVRFPRLFQKPGGTVYNAEKQEARPWTKFSSIYLRIYLPPSSIVFIAIRRVSDLVKKILPHQLCRKVGFPSASGLSLSFCLGVYVIGQEDLNLGDFKNEVNSDALFLLVPCREA